MQNHYSDILCALAEANVKFVVAGGVAVVLHGVERVTMDVDIAVQMEEANLVRFVTVMKSLNLQPRVPVPHEFIANPDNVRRIVEEKNAIVFTYLDPSNPLKHVDVFLTEDHSYESLVGDCETLPLRGQTIAIASIETLIRLKKAVDPPRAKDIHDIAELSAKLNK